MTTQPHQRQSPPHTIRFNREAVEDAAVRRRPKDKLHFNFIIFTKKMPRSRSSYLQRPSSYVVRQLAIRITMLARIVASNRREIPWAQETIFDYIRDIGIHNSLFESTYLNSMRLIRNARSVDLEYVEDCIAGIFDTMYPHDEL